MILKKKNKVGGMSLPKPRTNYTAVTTKVCSISRGADAQVNRVGEKTRNRHT